MAGERKEVLFFVGCHQPSDAQHFEHACISVNRLCRRKSGFKVRKWLTDSGAFTELLLHGEHRRSVEEYARQITRFSHCGELLAAVAQDYMCEPVVLRKTGLTVAEHQHLTIERYLRLLECGVPVPVMPVLQGFEPREYVAHLVAYGQLLKPGMWVGVGSVCKRNSSVRSVEAVLVPLQRERPDLRFHGFGLKETALQSPLVRECLYSSDSLAWSYAARRQGRDANDWREARAYVERVACAPVQVDAFGVGGKAEREARRLGLSDR
jgi:hypothetical protein